MSAPLKPWEAAGANYRSDISSLSMQSSSKVPDVNVRTVASAPPPLPPRPSNLATRRTHSSTGIVGGSHVYRGYPTTSSGYMSGYGGYGGYGNYGYYGSGYGGYGTAYSGYPYGYQNTNDNRLVALAEERTRPAFESIESVVRAFGSVSFMLESTLGALHASFRAALGVADHLSHLRNILSALSIFRLLQWCLRQIRRAFGGKHQDAAFGGIWGDAVQVGDQVGKGVAPSSAPSQWPLRAFIGIVISGSYLAWRLLSYIVGSGGPEGMSPFRGEEGEPWVLGKDPGCQLAIACYNFTATLDQELSVCVGDRLIVAPKARQPADCREWVLATHLRSAHRQNPPPPVKVGLVPYSYVRSVERRSRQAAYQMPGVPMAPGASVAQGHAVPVTLATAQQPPPPPPLPSANIPMAYGHPMVPVHPVAGNDPLAAGLSSPAAPVVPLPVELRVMQPPSGGSTAGLEDGPTAVQTLESAGPAGGTSADAKPPIDGGEGA